MCFIRSIIVIGHKKKRFIKDLIPVPPMLGLLNSQLQFRIVQFGKFDAFTHTPNVHN